MKLPLILLVLVALILPVRALDIPKGYTLQILEPTGGEIARPDGWFYTAQHHEPVLEWVISREDAAKGPYQTGFRIQALMGVDKHTGRSPRDYALSFLASTQKAASKLISSFPETKQGAFSCRGIEVEENYTLKKVGPKTYHSIYTVFWGTDSDIAIVTIASTPVDLWSKYQSYFQVMSAFQLIDPKKYAAEQPPAPAPSPQEK